MKMFCSTGYVLSRLCPAHAVGLVETGHGLKRNEQVRFTYLESPYHLNQHRAGYLSCTKVMYLTHEL